MYTRLTREGRAVRKIVLIATAVLFGLGYIVASIAASAGHTSPRRYVAPVPPPQVQRVSETPQQRLFAPQPSSKSPSSNDQFVKDQQEKRRAEIAERERINARNEAEARRITEQNAAEARRVAAQNADQARWIAAQNADQARWIAAQRAEAARQEQRLERVRQSLRPPQSPPQTTRPTASN